MSENANMFTGFGPGTFEFAPWPTSFENANVDIVEVVLRRQRNLPVEDQRQYYAKSLIKSSRENDLVVRIYDNDKGQFLLVTFVSIEAFRVLDENGLIEFWNKTKEMDGRPGQTTFKVRNHAWSLESPIPFLRSNGWAFVIATEDDCVEIVAEDEPIIEVEAAD